MTHASEERVFGLDALRAAAIASVVVAHSGLAFALATLIGRDVPVLNPGVPWLALLFHGGFVGVELFFVLSGFLIGGILLRSLDRMAKGPGLLQFYFRRWFRTLPLFWLFILFNVGLERYLRGRPIAFSEALGHALFLKNVAGLHLSFFPESWSLAVEEWFYLLFPAGLWLALKAGRVRPRSAFLACAAAFFFFSLTSRTLAAFQPGAEWVNGQRCVVLYRFDALMTGVIAAWAAVRWPGAWRRHARLAAILGLAVLAATYANLWSWSRTGVLVAPDSFFARTLRFNCFSIGFALLLPAASLWVPARESLAHRGVRALALWSYALYLIHWPVCQIIGSHFFPEWQTSGLEAALAFASKVVISVAISAFLYRFYESPTTRLRDRLAFSSRRQKDATSPQTVS